jgi:hypothetical protein
MMNGAWGRFSTCVALGLTGGMIGTAAEAGRWKPKIETSVRLAYDTNPFLIPGTDLKSGSVVGAIDPSLTYVTERGSIILSGNYERTEYFRRYDGNNAFGARLDAQEKLSSSLSVFAGLRYDNRVIGQNSDTVTSQPGTPPVDNTDVNLLGTSQRSQVYEASGGYTWRVGSKDTISGRAGATLTRYPNRPTGSDNDVYGGSIAYAHAISEHTKVGLSANGYYIDYDTPGLHTKIGRAHV